VQLGYGCTGGQLLRCDVCDLGNHNTQEPSQFFCRDMGQGWYWLLWSSVAVTRAGVFANLWNKLAKTPARVTATLLWSTGGVKVEGFLKGFGVNRKVLLR
jgi:hypothetical protein